MLSNILSIYFQNNINIKALHVIIIELERKNIS